MLKVIYQVMKRKPKRKLKRKRLEKILRNKPIPKKRILYLESHKLALTEITKEYDAIWEKHWRPAWEAINNGSANVNELASNMDAVTDGYTTMSSKNIDFDPKGLSKEHTQLLEDYGLIWEKPSHTEAMQEELSHKQLKA